MKEIAKAHILATFTKNTADWDYKFNSYVNPKRSKRTEKIEMKICHWKNKPKDLILKFDGGPTGFESFYIQDILDEKRLPRPKTFCICAGTTNSWEKCDVRWSDVIRFLKKNGIDIKEK